MKADLVTWNAAGTAKLEAERDAQSTADGQPMAANDCTPAKLDAIRQRREAFTETPDHTIRILTPMVQLFQV